MTGNIACGTKSCRAGKEVCVSSPREGHVSHCEPIAEWIDGKTPKPSGGFPELAGITACDSSNDCPAGSVCCLHEVGMAEVQAVVCHASLDECRSREEICSIEGAACRASSTRCTGHVCAK